MVFPLEQDDGVDFNSASLAHCIDTLVCLAFQVDAACIAAEQ